MLAPRSHLAVHNSRGAFGQAWNCVVPACCVSEVAMGVIRFLIDSPNRLTPAAVQRAYFSGSGLYSLAHPGAALARRTRSRTRVERVGQLSHPLARAEAWRADARDQHPGRTRQAVLAGCRAGAGRTVSLADAGGRMARIGVGAAARRCTQRSNRRPSCSPRRPRGSTCRMKSSSWPSAHWSRRSRRASNSWPVLSNKRWPDVNVTPPNFRPG